VLATVTKLNETAVESRKKEKRLLMDIAKYEGDRVKAVLRTGKNAWVYRAEEGLVFINMVVFEIKEVVKERGAVILASGEGKKGGQVVIVGQNNLVEGLLQNVKEAVTGIKGGGKGGRWQGKVIEWRNRELEALRKLVES
jgi:misacylated tRNA(Ala) deacylase